MLQRAGGGGAGGGGGGGGGGAPPPPAWGLYSYTRATTVSDFASAQLEVEKLREERRQLTHDLRAARAEAEQLKDEVVYVQRSQDIDGQACTAVRASLGQMQAEVSDLREQLAFYRGIVSPEQSKAGVRVYDFKVLKGSAAATFKYDLVVIQAVRNDRRVGGQIVIQLQGVQDGAQRSLGIDEVAVGPPQNLVFSFKYFEEFSGEFKLPQGFVPASVTVALQPSVEGAPKIEDRFEWSKILIGGGT
jgi:FtsZ-binding cell division protein ZapB